MIGYNPLSGAAGMACLTLAAESQLNGSSADWQTSPNGSDSTTSNAEPAISGRPKLAEGSQTSDLNVAQTADNHRFAHRDSEEDNLAAGSRIQGLLTAAAKQFSDITADLYHYILQSRASGSRHT